MQFIGKFSALSYKALSEGCAQIGKERELKRRSKVIGVFPNVDSLNRIIGSVILEQNTVYQERKSSSIPLSINEDMAYCMDELKILAEEQHQLVVA